MTSTRKRLTALEVERAKYIPVQSKGEKGAGKLLIRRLRHERGLYLAILPSGAKSWRFDFRYNGKRQCLVLGQYPELSLKAAEEKHIEARRLLADGKNPAAIKQEQKQQRAAIGDNSFQAVGEEWYAAKLKADPDLSQSWKENTRRWLNQAYAAFGRSPMPDIKPRDVLKLIKGVADKGYISSAVSLRETVSQVFSHGIANQYREDGLNPAAAVKDAIKRPEKKHHAKLEIDQIAPFLRAVKSSDEEETIKLGLLVLINTFPRRSELVGTPWTEIEADRWRIAPERTKMDRPHVIPLSPQVQAMFARLRELANGSPWVFPSPHTATRHRARQTFNYALNRLGYRGIFTPHGVRSTAASILADRGYSKDVVDAALAHAEESSVRASYFRNDYFQQRIAMMADWSTFLDGLEAGGAQVIPISAGRAA